MEVGLQCLGLRPLSQCMLLKYKGGTILIDCAIETDSLFDICPHPPNGTNVADNESKQSDSSERLCAVRLPSLSSCNWATVDVVLLSNCFSMLALPFVTEFTAFNGVIYATEPSVRFATMLLEELAVYGGQHQDNIAVVSRTPAAAQPPSTSQKVRAHDSSSTPGGKRRKVKGRDDARAICSVQTVQECMGRIKTVSFGQKISLRASCAADLDVVAVSSGFCIGGCNWIVQSSTAKIVFVGSSSSSVNRHPMALDIPPLRNPDICVMHDVAIERPLDQSAEAMLSRLCMHAETTIKRGGSVLIPVFPTGSVYDIIDVLSSHLHKRNASCPMFFVSPTARQSLAYATIVSEWLCKSKRAAVYDAQYPFPHYALQKSRALRVFDSVHDQDFHTAFRPYAEKHKPCVVFAGHPSARMGDVLYFLRLWGYSSNNMLLLVEPQFTAKKVLSGASDQHMTLEQAVRASADVTAGSEKRGLRIRVVECIVDARLSLPDANQLLAEIKPKHVVVPLAIAGKSAQNASAASSSGTQALSWRDVQTATGAAKLKSGARHVKGSNAPPSSSSSSTASTVATEQDSIVPRGFSLDTFSNLDTVKLATSGHDFERGKITAKLAASVQPMPVGGPTTFVSACRVSAQLVHRDNSFTMRPLRTGKTTGNSSAPSHFAAESQRRVLWGSVQVRHLLEGFAERGVIDVDVQLLGDRSPQPTRTKRKRKSTATSTGNDHITIDGDGVLLTIASLSATVLLKPGNTAVKTSSPQSRKLIRDVIVSRLCTL